MAFTNNYLIDYFKQRMVELFDDNTLDSECIKQSIDSVTTNLRSYLVFMLNLLLDYCNMQMRHPQEIPMTMDNFFWHYEVLWKKCTPEYEKDEFLKFENPTEYVR